MSARAVFLDRDGVLVRERGFITAADQLEVLPGAAAGMAVLHRAGFLLVVATNQSAVARGLLTGSALAALHAELARKLKAEDPQAFWDALYACPHHPDFGPGCDCRKPAPGMLRRAAAEHGIDLAASWMVGDAPRDLQAGRAAGCRTVALPPAEGGDLAARDLAEAASRLV